MGIKKKIENHLAWEPNYETEVSGPIIFIYIHL